MRVLIAGAAGFIGRHVARELQSQGGHQLAGLSRSPRQDGGIEWRVGDVTHPETLPAAVRDVECVVHAVQFPNHPVENPSRGWTYLKVDGEGTRNMVQACVRAGVRRFLYFSGAGTREGRTEPWFRAKMMAEQAVRESGMEWVILRPSWIYGPDDQSMNKLVAFTRNLPVVPVIGPGEERVQPIHVDDVARVAALAVSSPEATGRIFDLGGPEFLSMNEILRTIQRVLGVRKPLVHHPVGLMKLAAAALQVLPKPPLSPAAIDFLRMENRVDPRPAEETFGFRFRPLEEGLSYLRDA
ncbi:MAG: SDR family oxidoreductase [Armatimonadota bacterium]